MAELDFSDEQMAALRRALGFRQDDREATAEDILAVAAAQQIVNAESLRWYGLGPGDR